MKITKHIYNDRIEWRNENGDIHNSDGPAVEFNCGDKIWFQNGLRHRLDGPAIEKANGGKVWYQNGQRHRIDGPAIEYIDGRKEWFQNGKLHRSEGPAIEFKKEGKSWHFNGKRNRFDSEKKLKTKLQETPDIKQFLIKNVSGIDPGEVYLLRLIITNHFPSYLHFLDKLLILQ